MHKVGKDLCLNGVGLCMRVYKTVYHCSDGCSLVEHQLLAPTELKGPCIRHSNGFVVICKPHQA